MSGDVANRAKPDQDRPSRSSAEHTAHRGPDARTLAFAAVLLIEDTHTDEEIARALGVTRRTLARWKQRPDVALALRVHDLLESRQFFRSRRLFWKDEEQGPLP